MTLLIFIVVLLGAIAFGIPISFALLASAVALMLYHGIFDTQIIAQSLVQGADNFPLMAIPFFILAGELMNQGGLSKRIINFALSFIGHIRGGLGYVAIFASVMFAGLSGSAVADMAAIGAVLIPMMVNAGYNKPRSVGLIAAGGIIAPIIPPSIPLIIFGVTGGVSITKLFMAGIVPGLLIAVGLTIVWYLVSRKSETVTFNKTTAKEKWTATKNAVWALVLPLLIIGGLRTGAFSPTEAGVVAVFYVLVVSLFVYREVKFKDLYDILVRAAKTSSIVMFLVASAMVSAWIVAYTNVPAMLTDILAPLINQPTLLLLAINVLILVFGMVMDLIPIILIMTPVLMPIIDTAGIDPVYFGVILVMNCCISLLTPPVGAVLNVATAVGRIDMLKLLKGIWPFILVEVIILFLLILFPSIVTVPLEWLT